jgi:hypothetical protein
MHRTVTTRGDASERGRLAPCLERPFSHRLVRDAESWHRPSEARETSPQEPVGHARSEVRQHPRDPLAVPKERDEYRNRHDEQREHVAQECDLIERARIGTRKVVYSLVHYVVVFWYAVL